MMKKQIALVALLFLGMSCFNASSTIQEIQFRQSYSSRKRCRTSNLSI